MFYALIGISAVLFILAIVFGCLVYSLSSRLRKLTTGTNGKNLEDAIYQLMEDHSILGHRTEILEQKTGRLDTEMKSAARGIATVRYNAFTDVGGKQSFATAFVDETGNGVVISSLYARDRVNVYAKPIVGFKSEYELTGEESRALKEAAKTFN